MINVKWDPEGRADHLGRHGRRCLPRPFADQGKPVASKYPGLTQSAARKNPFPGSAKHFRVGRIPSPSKRCVAFHRGIDIAARSIVVNLPRAVGTLLVED